MSEKTIYMSLTDKGGTGKTLHARLLAYRLINAAKNPLLVDGDGEIGGLFQFHDDALPIRFTGDAKDRDKMMSILDSNRDTIIVDMPAASLTSLSIFNDEHGFFNEMKKTGYNLTLINVITPFKNSIRTVSEMIDLAGDNADYIVIENGFFGDHEDFFIWHGDDKQPTSKAKQKLLEVGGKIVTGHALMTGVLAAIDLENYKFEEALENLERRAHRTRLHTWLEKMDKEFAKIGL